MRKLMVTTVAVTFIGAAGLAGAADYTFALVPKNVNNPFFDQARDGCKKAEKELERTLGRAPDREEISSHLSKSMSKIDKVLQHGVHETSLDVGVGEDQETPLAEILAARTLEQNERMSAAAASRAQQSLRDELLGRVRKFFSMPS